MSFWRTLGEVAMAAAESINNVSEVGIWLREPLDNADTLIQNFMVNASKKDIENAFNGFRILFLSADDSETTSKLMILFFIFLQNISVHRGNLCIDMVDVLNYKPNELL